MRVLGRLLFGAIAAVTLLGVGSSCRALDPPNRPLDRCQVQCREKAKRNCSEDACVRGCEFILDRLIEREGPNVIADHSRAIASGDPSGSQARRPKAYQLA